MPSTCSPVRVSVVGPPLICAGVESLLAAHRDRVTLLPPHSFELPDVEIFDPLAQSGPLAVVDPSPVPLVALMRRWDAGAIAHALALGAVTVLHLDADAEEIVATLQEVRLGADAGTADRPDGGLSRRETQVLAGICRGLSNDEIAAELFVSINSVKTYIRSAYRKIGLTRRSQAVLWGIEHGYESRPSTWRPASDSTMVGTGHP